MHHIIDKEMSVVVHSLHIMYIIIILNDIGQEIMLGCC